MQIHYAQPKREEKEDISESLAACHTYVVSVALLSIIHMQAVNSKRRILKACSWHILAHSAFDCGHLTCITHFNTRGLWRAIAIFVVSKTAASPDQDRNCSKKKKKR